MQTAALEFALKSAQIGAALECRVTTGPAWD
jgi:hypothetical protein